MRVRSSNVTTKINKEFIIARTIHYILCILQLAATRQLLVRSSLLITYFLDRERVFSCHDHVTQSFLKSARRSIGSLLENTLSNRICYANHRK